MSYSDYNYQQNSVVSSGGNLDTSYSQGSYNTSEYATPTTQYDYSYSDYYSYSYSQPADSGTTVNYTSTDQNLNTTSYTQENTSSVYDETQAYSQAPTLQYSNPAGHGEAAAATTNPIEMEAKPYYNSTAVDQYEQPPDTYSYTTSQREPATARFPNQSFESQDYSPVASSGYMNEYQTTQNIFSGYQDQQSKNYQDSTSDGYQNSQSTTYDNSSSSGDYQQTSQSYQYQGTASNNYPNSQSQSQRYQDSSSGSYQNSQSNYQESPSNAYQDMPSGGYQYSQLTGYGRNSQPSGYQSATPSGFQNSKSEDSNYPQSATANYQSNPSSSGINKYAAGTGGVQNAPSRGFTNQSNSFGSDRLGFNSDKDGDKFGSFSQTPNKPFGSFSQRGRGGFSSQQNNYQTHSGPEDFSRQGMRGGNNNSSQFRKERGAAITGRNFENQHRPRHQEAPGFPKDRNMWSQNSDSFRGGSWGGGRGQFSQNRGGFKNDRTENTQSSSMRGRFNNFNSGPSSRGRGNQFRPHNQQPGILGDKSWGRKVPGNNRDFNSEDKNKNEKSVSKTTTQTSLNRSDNESVQTKAPSYQNQKLLNEVEEKKNKKPEAKGNESSTTAKKAEEEKKGQESVKGKEEKKEETAEKGKEEAAKDEASFKVLAPPSKVPETPEEIAREEEIQRKIRESVVVIKPDQEKPILGGDPLQDVEISSELNDILKSLSTPNFCKLCYVGMAGPQMATMHYNGKNHLKKVRFFVQTKGRSAGYNTDTTKEDENSADKTNTENSAKEEEKEIDEKKYCKTCQITFQDRLQSEIHYKGKNHAKKLRRLEMLSQKYECKMCCIILVTQDQLTAHLNGKNHKMRLQKMEGDNAHRGGLRGRGVQRGRGGGRGGPGNPQGDRDQAHDSSGFRGRGNGRGRGNNWRGGYGRGFKRPTDSFNPAGSFFKRPRFNNIN